MASEVGLPHPNLGDDLVDDGAVEKAGNGPEDPANRGGHHRHQHADDKPKDQLPDIVVHENRSSAAERASSASFIFASSNLNQFYMRFKYLEQYTSARKNQVQLIVDIKNEIEGEKVSLEKTKEEKNLVLVEQVKEKEKPSNLF